MLATTGYLTGRLEPACASREDASCAANFRLAQSAADLLRYNCSGVESVRAHRHTHTVHEHVHFLQPRSLHLDQYASHMHTPTLSARTQTHEHLLQPRSLHLDPYASHMHTPTHLGCRLRVAAAGPVTIIAARSERAWFGRWRRGRSGGTGAMGHRGHSETQEEGRDGHKDLEVDTKDERETFPIPHSQQSPS